VSKRETPPADGKAGLPLSPEEALALALFVFLAGRGGAGKTLLLRWIVERAIAAGRLLVIADGDRTNRSLPLFLDGVLTPNGADDATVWRWLEAIITRMVADLQPRPRSRRRRPGA
jgi:hypothetical protein